MSNIQKNSNLQREKHTNQKKGQRLDLSSCPNLTDSLEAYVHVKQFKNNEGFMSVRVDSKDFKIPKPPIQCGERTHKNGISRKTRSKITRSIRILGNLADKFTIKKVFITLTYGKHYPDDKLSKKHLDAFYKSITRYLFKQGEILITVWVAERQKRGAIHYHIFSLNYIPKEILNEIWNRIVKKWQNKYGHPPQTVCPNIKTINRPANYMAKYLTKGETPIKGNIFNMSKHAQAITKPILEQTYKFKEREVSAFLENWITEFKAIDRNCFVSKGVGSKCIVWSKESIHALAEIINKDFNKN